MQVDQCYWREILIGKEMGLSPKDMDFLELKNMSARDIALCFGVPSQLVGVPDSQTYNNVSEARLALYEDTIIPLIRRVESDMNEWLAPRFGDDISIRYDIDSIPAMAERRKKTYENVVTAVREGIISRNGKGKLDMNQSMEEMMFTSQQIYFLLVHHL